MFLAVPSATLAQTATSNPEDEYKKLVKVDTEIQPLGDTPFGESVNPYDGGLSFHVVDVSVPGNGPTIEIGRTFTADGDAEVRWNDAAFGDWELDVPWLTTMTSNASTIIAGPNQIGWLVNSVARTDRCTNFREPPDQRIGRPGTEPLSSEDWWNEGYTLYTPGQPSQDVLSRNATSPAAPQDGTVYQGITKQFWHLGCLASTANGEAGEAFIAKGPDGTRIWLNQLAYRPARGYRILRRLGLMFATRLEDRFGNALTYTYNGAHLTRIDGSDGRVVTLDYAADGIHVAHVNVVTAAGTRTWTYGYTPVTGGSVLSSVTLPDGTAWNYNLVDLAYDVKSTPPNGHCKDPALPDESLLKVGTISGPSGLQGRFEMRPTRHARSWVREYCDATDPSQNGFEHAPRYSNNLALRTKTFTGTGTGNLTWSYSYPVATGSWKNECQASGCSTTTYSEMVDPAGNTTRFTFSNRADASEGKPIKTEVFQGGAGSAPIRTETLGYPASATAGPWPSSYGYGFANYVNQERQQSELPMSSKVISQDGDSYTWQALSFDAFARPATTQRSSSFGYSVTEGHAYRDDVAKSVIGLPAQETNLTENKVVSAITYDPNSLTPLSRAAFGQTVMSYTFNAQGQLASFTDANQHTTTLGNYKRGIPQTIVFPDVAPDHPGGTSESISVDDFGQIAAITDQAGATTSYSYDAIGRVTRVDYPSGDSVAWAPKTFSYSFIGDARGMGGNHWMRLVTQGNHSERTDFDALLRPVMQGKAEANTGALYVSSRTEYDWKGRKTFESYPVDGAPDRTAIVAGLTHAYDALGRQISTTQPSELNKDITASSQYLSGGRRRDTDGRGNVTVSSFQAFDQPAYDNPVRIEAPESVTQIITRDTFGNPTLISQGGINRTLVYDGQNRLCRTFDPETGYEVQAYDAVGNLAWNASVSSITGETCGLDQVPSAAKVNRAYDSMNRVTSIAYPQGALATSFTYDIRGNIASTTAANAGPSGNTTGTVTWTYGRNKMGLLTAEVLAVDGWSWGFAYSYDNVGRVSAVQYPDGENVAFNPNALDQPTSAGRFASGATYWPNGQVKAFSLANGMLYSSDQTSRQMIRNFTFGTASHLVVSEDRGYDEGGNVVSLTDRSGSSQRSRNMTYDGLNRLVSATSGLWGSENYTYDALNNIRSITGSSGINTYNYNGLNQLATITNAGNVVHSFAYDARGNTSTRDGQALTFDQANRLLAVAGKGEYLYDATGHRVKAVTPSGTTYSAYNSAGKLMWQYNQATADGTDYIYLGKMMVGDKKASTAVVIGNIDGVSTGTNAVISGWACATGIAGPIDVHLYVGGPAGTGTGVGAWTANLASEQGIQAACHSTGTLHRFSIPLTDAVRVQHGGKAIYIHGISPTGGANLTIAGSGSFTIPPSVSAPPSPTAVTASVSSDQNTVNVSWTGSGAATSYIVERSYNGQAYAQVWTGTATSTALGGAVDGSYLIRVSACNANGCSVPAGSNTVSVAHQPATPGSIGVPANSTGSVAISWPAAAYATSYQIEHSTGGGWVNVWSGAATSATVIEGASANWYYRVRSCNANGCSGYATSGPVSVIRTPAAPSIAGGGGNNSGAYTISWSAVADAPIYNLIESFNGGAWQQVQYSAATSWGTSGRGNGTYTYQVQGCNSLSCGPWSGQTTVTVTLIPAVPGGVLRDSVTGKRENYTLYWDPVPLATRYEILVVQTNRLINAGTATSYLVEGGTVPYLNKYSYRLRACNDQGCSDWSGITG